MRAVLPALVALATLLAGCATPVATQEPAAAPGAGASSDAHALLAFAPAPVSPLRCEEDCFEPTVAIDALGRMFVTDAGTPLVSVSLDGGATWTLRDAPPVAEPLEGAGDVMVQIAPDGALYYSALLYATAIPGGVPRLAGIQVAWSDDAAATWTGNTILSALDEPTTPVVYPDRQWLGFGPEGEVYLTYNQIPSGIWIARSDDRGETFDAWTRVAPLEDRRGIGQSGPPVVDARGRVAVPACTLAPPGLVVYLSEDGGRTFAREEVPTQSCSFFPVVAPMPDGTFVASWNDLAGAALVSLRDDDGWSEDVAWASGSVTAPWPIVRGDGALDLAWIGGDDLALRVSSGDPRAGPEADVLVQEGLRSDGATHFAHGTRGADGRLALVWASDRDVLAALQVVPT